MKKTLSSLIPGLVLACLLVAALAGTNTSSGLTAKGVGLAAHGYDVVAYFSGAKPVLGDARHTATYLGAAYRFASSANLRRFEANPKKYAPQYGGYCAYGVYAGAKFDGDPRIFRIVGGKLYFNLNQEIRDKWEEDIAGHIRKADRNWDKIREVPPQDL